MQEQRKGRGRSEGNGVKVQMVEISGYKAKVGKREREVKTQKRENPGSLEGGRGRFSLSFFSSKMGRETRKVSSTWWLLGPVVVTVPSGGGVSDDDGGSA